MVSFVEAWWIMDEYEKLSTKPPLFFLKEEATFQDQTGVVWG